MRTHNSGRREGKQEGDATPSLHMNTDTEHSVWHPPLTPTALRCEPETYYYNTLLNLLRPCSVGDRVEAQYGMKESEAWFVGTVVAVHDAEGTCDVHYEDGDKEVGKPWARVRAAAVQPPRSGMRCAVGDKVRGSLSYLQVSQVFNTFCVCVCGSST